MAHPKLTQFLHPILVARFSESHTYWLKLLESYGQQHPSFRMFQSFLEALYWLDQAVLLRDNLSLDQVEGALLALSPRELSIVEYRSRGWVYREIASELGISFPRVRELYQRVLKQCGDYMLDQHKPDPLSLNAQAERFHLLSQTAAIDQSNQQNGHSEEDRQALQQIWGALEQTLQKHLGSGGRVVLERLQTQMGRLDPRPLRLALYRQLADKFAEQYAAGFSGLLEEE